MLEHQRALLGYIVRSRLRRSRPTYIHVVATLDHRPLSRRLDLLLLAFLGSHECCRRLGESINEC